MSREEARKQGREAALAGRPRQTNLTVAMELVEWYAAYDVACNEVNRDWMTELRCAVLKSNKSCTAIADAAGLNPGQIIKFANGLTNVSSPSFEKLARTLGYKLVRGDDLSPTMQATRFHIGQRVKTTSNYDLPGILGTITELPSPNSAWYWVKFSHLSSATMVSEEHLDAV